MQVQSEKPIVKALFYGNQVFKKILVALDGSETSSKAAKVVIGLAEKLKFELVVLHAITPPHPTMVPHAGLLLEPHHLLFLKRRTTATTDLPGERH